MALETYMQRLKYGLGLGLESLSFAKTHKDLFIVALLGSLTAGIVSAALFAALTFLVIPVLGSPLRSATSMYTLFGAAVATTAVYAFALFFFRCIIVHAAGSRMLGTDESVTEAAVAVKHRYELFLQWALITGGAKLVSTLVKSVTDSGNLTNTSAKLVHGIWYLATFFIPPVLVFYSEDAVKDEGLKSVQVLRQNLFAIVSLKALVKLLTVGLTAIGIFLTLFVYAGTGGWFGVKYLVVGIVLVVYAVWLIEKVIYDIARTALYINTETSIDLHGFNTGVIDYEQTTDEDLEADFIPEQVDDQLADWTDHGTFEHRL